MNDALGSVRLEIENGALYLDIGEVRMMLRASPGDPACALAFLTADPPVASPVR